MKLTNNTEVPLALAVGLLADYYDHVDKPNYLSTTTILKPIKQVILSKRVTSRSKDLIDYHHTFMGSAIHAALEKAWLTKDIREQAMLMLGYKQSIIDLVEVNPETPTEGKIQIYVEPPRKYGKVFDWFIGGKPDLILDGVLHDYKNTSTYKWIKKDYEDFRLQLSIYRWLYRDIVTADHGVICFSFKDWSEAKALREPDYPNSPEKALELQLLSLEETDKFIHDKFNQAIKYLNADESEIPECTQEELWVDPPKYKYFSNPDKTDGRSTKNFTDPVAANAFLVEKGKGIVIEELGQPKRCNYCDASEICQQRKKYYPDE